MPDDANENIKVIEDKIDEWLEAHQEIQGILTIGDTVLDTIKDINSWVGTAIAVLELIGVFGEKKSPFEALFEALDSRLRQILDVIHNHDLLESLKDISNYVGDAITSAKDAKKFIDNGRPSDEDVEDEYLTTHIALDKLLSSRGRFGTIPTTQSGQVRFHR